MKVIINRQAAFSLVEVTLAMAIAAVALVSIIGMLPQGMKTMQEAGDRAIEARIHQQILSELQMTPYGDDSDSPLDDYDGLEIFYDSQGEELGDTKTNSSTKGSFKHIYTARINVPSAGEKTPESVGRTQFDGFKFSGDSVDSDASKYLRPVIVEIAAVGGQGARFKWDEPDSQRMISTYQGYVVKMGQDYTN